jgi:FkbM family methyltransferase
MFRVTSITEACRIEKTALEQELLQRLVASLKDGDILFDIGANIGVVSLFAAKSTSSIRILAFEPEQKNFLRLSQNIALNRLTARVQTINIALADKNGETLLWVGGNEGNGSHSLVPGRGLCRQRNQIVSMMTTDSFIANGETPSVVKIDVEGAEVQVLDGMKMCLEHQFVRHLFIEVHPDDLARQGQSYHDITGILTRYGYGLVWSACRGTEYLCHFSALSGMAVETNPCVRGVDRQHDKPSRTGDTG